MIDENEHLGPEPEKEIAPDPEENNKGDEREANADEKEDEPPFSDPGKGIDPDPSSPDSDI